jgi:hypothetical protein
MKRRLALAISSLALGWISFPALADEPIMAKPQATEVAMAPASVAAPDLAAAETLPAPAAAAGDKAGPAPVTTYSAVAPYHGEACPMEDEGHGHKHGHKHGGGGGIQAGVATYYLQPHYETNPAFTASRQATDGTLQIRQEDFDYDYEFAPLVWAGWVSCDGFGFRGRAWRYENDASVLLSNDGQTAFDSAAPLGLQNLSTTLGDTLLYATDLQIRVYDAEATQSWNVCGWGILLAGGVRYAQINQSYVHVELPAGDTLVDAISSGSNFKGIGPTVALEVRRELGGSGLALYGSARGSLLFGKGKQDAFQVVNNTPNVFASTSRDDVMPITEFEVGAEFGRSMGRGRFFAQAALVGQVWHGAGNGAQNEMIPVLVDPEVSDNSSNLGLFGGKVAIGINY